MTSVSDTYQQKLMRSIATFLKRWNGSEAKLWDYQAAHCALTLRLTSAERKGNLHLICLGPVFITGPVSWANCHIEVFDGCVLPNGDVGYVIVDRSVGFEVRTESVEVKENCRPLA
jgi:hypothetical protein